MLFLWAVLSVCAFVLFILIIRALLLNREPELGDGTLSAEMQREIAAALREKYAAIKLVAEEKDMEATPGRRERMIALQLDRSEDLELAIGAVLRDALRWFDHNGIECGRVTVSLTAPQEIADSFSALFDQKVRTHKRIQEMVRMGCPISLEIKAGEGPEDGSAE